MNYIEKINVLDLFAGCGGPALGFEQDADACDTYRRNLEGDCKQVMVTTETQFQ